MQHLVRFRIFFLIAFLYTSVLPAQSPYQFSTGKEAAILGVGGATLGISIPIDKRVQPFNEEQLAIFDSRNVWGLDRWGTRQYSLAAQQASDVLLIGSLGLPATMALDNPSRKYFGQVSLLYLETFLMTTGVTNLTKALIKRPRPFLYNPDVPIEEKMRRRSRYSFFSGHTAMTASMTFLTAKMYSDFYPGSKAGPYVWISAAAIPALTGYLRIRGGKHYLTDVLIGYGVGAVIGILIPELHR